MSPLISPDVIAVEMARVARLCAELEHLAGVVDRTYRELYEQSLSPTHMGERIRTRDRGFANADPTGDTAASALHARMRLQALRAARVLRRITHGHRCERCGLPAPPILEEAESLLIDGFMELDPEMAAKLAHLREIAAEMR